MDNPFGGSAKAMFEDFEKASKKPGPGSLPNEKDMQDFEKNFMGMF
jgi:soluble cytochrome b562